MMRLCLTGMAINHTPMRYFWVLAMMVGVVLVGNNRMAQAGQPYGLSAAHPVATQVGADILARGGSAVDAMIAVQLTLGLVEPQSSGIGGGAFMLYWDAEAHRVEAYDAREAAPAAAMADMFLDPQGKPIPFRQAVRSGSSVGVPGVPALLVRAHADHGKLPWQDLFAPAIALAEKGFKVTPRFNAMVGRSLKPGQNKAIDDYFFTGKQPVAVGTVLRNPAYAQTLRLLAAKGDSGFYRGPVAAAIVEAVTHTPHHPSSMNLVDLLDYHVRKPYPLCATYRGYKVCGMPPPTSGGITLLQILGLIEAQAIPQPTDSIAARHLIAQASRLAYADRAAYIADLQAMKVAPEALLEPAYLKSRAAVIGKGALANPQPVAAGIPPGLETAPSLSAPKSRPSTTHFAIMDDEGNVVTMTSSIEGPFGSNLMVGGFLLNNQLTDFSFRPERDGKPVANAVAGGKRPRSSMAPTLIFDSKGRFIAALGSPGGSRIIAYVATAVIHMLENPDRSLDEIFALPHSVNRNGKLDLEAGTDLAAQAEAFSALGYTVNPRALTSGLHGLRFSPERGTLEGGADPRREGVVSIGMTK